MVGQKRRLELMRCDDDCCCTVYSNALRFSFLLSSLVVKQQQRQRWAKKKKNERHGGGLLLCDHDLIFIGHDAILRMCKFENATAAATQNFLQILRVTLECSLVFISAHGCSKLRESISFFKNEIIVSVTSHKDKSLTFKIQLLRQHL